MVDQQQVERLEALLKKSGHSDDHLFEFHEIEGNDRWLRYNVPNYYGSINFVRIVDGARLSLGNNPFYYNPVVTDEVLREASDSDDPDELRDRIEQITRSAIK